MDTTFAITHDRGFLKHFLTRWRTLSLSADMVRTLRDNAEDPFAAYGYARWLSLANPGGNSLQEAESLLVRAANSGRVPDAKAALAELYYDGRVSAGKAMPEMHAFLMDSAYKEGSELAQLLTLENTLYGSYGFPEDPAQVADILRGHLEKNPGSDPIYYDLLGSALETSDPSAAEKAYVTCIERGETEGYYSLAHFYKSRGEVARSYEVAKEGAGKGAVNCLRFKAGMAQEDFLALSPEEQEALHAEIAEGLDEAIARFDRYACYLKGVLLYFGELGFEKDVVAALEALERGCELGQADCSGMVSAIQHDEAGSLPPEMRLSPQRFAEVCLQAVRMGDHSSFNLEQAARAYVAGLLPAQEEEIETLWLDKYLKVSLEGEDGENDSRGVVAVYPQGFYYCMDVEEEREELDLDALAGNIGARRFDVVHFSPLLTRITKALLLDRESRHVAMLVDRDGYAKDLPDNMPGTILYGQGAEIRGTVIFVLEDDRHYTLMPMQGLPRVYMFLQMLDAATGGLVRLPSDEELEAIGADGTGGFEEYDDPGLEDSDASDVSDSREGAEESEEAGTGGDGLQEDPPSEWTVPLDEMREAIRRCNLCRDTLFVLCPDSTEYDFMSADELMDELGIKEAIEENIERHGGYMIDEWQYVDHRQVPMDIRSRVRFVCPD